MAIQHAIWKVGTQPVSLSNATLENEQLLEDMIVAAPQILSNEWMLIGKQEQTGMGGRIDLLAIAPDASIVLIELKRNRTPREIVAQALDYASWVDQLTSDKLVQIYHRFSDGKTLGDAFKEKFGIELNEENLNASHQIIIVAAELDATTERIIKYLNDRDIAINVMFFQVFQYGNDQLLSRAWLIDPKETQVNVTSTTKTNGDTREPWNGEYYVSFGGNCLWNDARTYGFISAGGGSWYTRTLNLLSPGDRIWVNIPGVGYVGVARVVEPATPVNEFMINTIDGMKPAIEILQNSDRLRNNSEDPEISDFFVRVNWLDSLAETEAVREVGLFGNQNTVCQPTSPRWRHTVDRLKSFFKNWDATSEAE